MTEEFTLEFEAYRPKLARLCRRILGQPERAEDAIHDTFLRAHRNWSQFDGANFPAWLSRIAKHVCIDQIRAELLVRSLESDDEQPGAGDEVRLLTAIQIRTILSKLPDQQRQCLKLFYIEGFSAKEVAKKACLSEKDVKSHLQNGRRRFILEWERLKKKTS